MCVGVLLVEALHGDGVSKRPDQCLMTQVSGSCRAERPSKAAPAIPGKARITQTLVFLSYQRNLNESLRCVLLQVNCYNSLTISQSPSDSFQGNTMSYVAKGEKEYDATGAPVPSAKIHKIRITLTSSNVKNLEKCACVYFLGLIFS